MHRSIGYHLIQSYLPSILIVAISWVSFWMDIDCVPARVTLGVITLLTVSGLVSGNTSVDIGTRYHIYEFSFQNKDYLNKSLSIFHSGEKGGIPQTSYVKVSKCKDVYA